MPSVVEYVEPDDAHVAAGYEGANVVTGALVSPGFDGAREGNVVGESVAPM